MAPGFHVGAHLGNLLGEVLVLHLAEQHAQRTADREARLDHGGELAGEECDLFVLNPVRDPGDDDLGLEAVTLGRGDGDGQVAHLPEPADDEREAVALEFALDQLARLVPDLVVERDRHLARPLPGALAHR